MSIRTVLFDLDGTLIDSAPALVAAANAVRRQMQLPELPFQAMRNVCSLGVRGLLWAGLRLAPSARRFDARKQALLAYYEAHINEGCEPFDGVLPLLSTLDQQGIFWGVVTNKHSHLAALLCEANAIRPACLIGGDTTANPKPAPDPILLAMQKLGADPASTLYVGDDQRDIDAGRSAGCRTIAVTWGYVGQKNAPSSWKADWVINHPLEILEIVNSL